MATTLPRTRIELAQPRAISASDAIDDLIKFRLIESMVRQPDRTTTPAELAARLGFHSVELTGAALDELVEAGLVRARRDAGTLSYRLVADQRVHAEIAELIAKGPPGMFNRLAAGSVRRVKKLLGKRRGIAPDANPSA